MIDVTSIRCGYGSKEVLKGISLEVGLWRDGRDPGTERERKDDPAPGTRRCNSAPEAAAIRLGGKDISRDGKAGKQPGRLLRCLKDRTSHFPFRCLSVVLMGRYPHLDAWGGYSPEDIEIALDVQWKKPMCCSLRKDPSEKSPVGKGRR